MSEQNADEQVAKAVEQKLEARITARWSSARDESRPKAQS
jgi:hypothetical protein